ncbi:MAG: hypothetical protein EPN25_12860 [Nitrospirae bacterium]|nr:MAG: hypothetical protein EPN25_12860 [Nitrospirota bacterium]
MRFYIIIIPFIIILSGCSTLGLPQQDKLKQIDFGAPETIRFCILKDDRVAQAKVDELIEAIRLELSQYALNMDIPWVRPWKRPGFWIKDIHADLAARPLEEPCDRLLAFAGTSAGDFILGAQTYGSVETTSRTKGFVFAEWYSLVELLSFYSPQSVAVHESYHLLGCKHGVTMEACYDQLKRIKAITAKQRKAGNDFFPGIGEDDQLLLSRDEVNNKFGSRLRATIKSNQQTH